MLEHFVAFIALERPLPCVRPHVALQFISCSALVVARVTLKWLLSCMVPHHVIFQITIGTAGIVAHCASLRLFPRVGPVVLLQIS